MTVRAEIIADSISLAGFRLTTFEIYYPRIILAEVNTHRILAKSSQSSRAVPVEKRIQQVIDDPYIPKQFGKNQRGMQAHENLSDDDTATARSIWRGGINEAVNRARLLSRTNLHKQFANRVLEPYAHVHTVLTGTEWDNFWDLRCHPDAQPEFQELAALMGSRYSASLPRYTEGWHLPYILPPEEDEFDTSDLRKLSVARCARVSYRMHDGAIPLPEKDLALADKLVTDKHMSPFEHQARPGVVGHDQTEDQRHLVGWIPYRTLVERELGIKSRRFYSLSRP